MTEIVNDCLRHDFSFAVRTLSIESRSFGDGNDRRCAIDGCRRRVDNSATFIFVHNLEKGDRCTHIIGVIRKWDFG